jgi:hypothetical protein
MAAVKLPFLWDLVPAFLALFGWMNCLKHRTATRTAGRYASGDASPGIHQGRAIPLFETRNRLLSELSAGPRRLFSEAFLAACRLRSKPAL